MPLPLLIRYDDLELILSFLFREMAQLISRIDILQFGLDPDLEKIYVLLPDIVLLMSYPVPGAHDLYTAFFDHRTIAHRVFMIHLPFKQHGNTFHIHMRMNTESFPLFYIVIVKSL